MADRTVYDLTTEPDDQESAQPMQPVQPSVQQPIVPLPAHIPAHIPTNLHAGHGRKRKAGGSGSSTSFSSSSTSSNPRSKKVAATLISSTILKCCACDLNNDAEYVHPVLHVPICGRCNKMYHDANFTVDSETGNCWECLMCGVGDGNWMFMCDQCPHSFCQRCVEFSVGKTEAGRVRALKEWVCYACEPTPAFSSHAVDKDFAFFNMESVYDAIIPPKDTDLPPRASSSGVTRSRDRWCMPIYDTVVPQQLVALLTRSEKYIASLICSQMTNSLMPLLRIVDTYISAKEIQPLRCLSKNLRHFFQFVVMTPGLFHTPFGDENSCRLHPHQNVSLRWMTKTENFTEEFGKLRGGVIADAPGLGKTVTMLALIVSTAGKMPIEPTAFWDTRAMEDLWAEGGGSSEGNFRRVERALRDTLKNSELRWYPKQLTAEAFHDRFKAGHFPTLFSLEHAFREEIRAVSVQAADPQHGEVLRQAFRSSMISAKASMDKRSRSTFQSTAGMRMLLERSLHPSSCTLIVVPMALLEHWFEQIKRHLGLDYLAHSTATATEREQAVQNGMGDFLRGGSDEDSLKGRRGVVYFDGLGDILDVEAPLPRLRLGGKRKTALELSQYLIVVTTFERCEALQTQANWQEQLTSNLSSSTRAIYRSPNTVLELSKIRWLRLVVDEGHELGAIHSTSTDVEAVTPATAFIRDIAAERRWVMSGTPTTGTQSSAALTQIQRLLVFLRHEKWGVGADASRQWQRLVAQPFLRQDHIARELLETILRQTMIRHTKKDLRLFEPIRHTVVLDAEEDKRSLAEKTSDPRVSAVVSNPANNDEDDNEIDKLKAKYIYATIQAANAVWRQNVSKGVRKMAESNNAKNSLQQALTQERLLRPAKVIVFSTDKSHLAGVGHFLYLWLGDRGVCEHGGSNDETIGTQARKYISEMRSAELSRFRTSKRKYRVCPLCGGENFITGGPACTKTLLLVEYDLPPEGVMGYAGAGTSAGAEAIQPPPYVLHAPSANPTFANTWISPFPAPASAPAEETLLRFPARAPAPTPLPAEGGHGASGQGSFFKGECLCSINGCRADGRPANQCRGLPNPFARKNTRGADGEQVAVFADNEIYQHANTNTRGKHLALVTEEHLRHWVPGRRFTANEEVFVLPAPAYDDADTRLSSASPHSDQKESAGINLEKIRARNSASGASQNPSDSAAPGSGSGSGSVGGRPILWRSGRLGGYARVRAWKRCGKGAGHSGWHSGAHILKSVPWHIDNEDATVLLLQEDGSTGLDLSFATHIFLLDQLRDPALENQIISRAHRMGAKGPVDVTLLLANEVGSKEMAAQTAAAVKESMKKKKQTT